MTPKEKALELYNKFEWYTHGYTGGSMLSDTEFLDVKKERTQACCLIAVSEILNGSKVIGTKAVSRRKFWYNVQDEINKL